MDVHAMHAAYGNYAPANVFANNDTVAELADTEAPMYDAAFEADPTSKRHAACDECRKRKLKCSGEPTGCGRCVKQMLSCHYSKQAVMGRPRKKRKASQEEEQGEPLQSQLVVEQPIQPLLPDFMPAHHRAEFESLCPGPITQYIKNRTPAPPAPFVTQGPLYEHTGSFMESGSGGTPSSDSPPTPNMSQHEVGGTTQSKDMANWPDFSNMTMLPQIVQDNHPHPSDSADQLQAVEPTDSVHNLPKAPACACLPNLYLTLSALSILSSFPVSIHTIESLQTAHRSAQSVLYCAVCPTTFQTGMQNVMLSGTLLNVLADNWHRVRTAPAEELRSGFSPSGIESMAAEPLTDLQSLEWRTFAYQLLRANVFGDKTTPCPPRNQSSTDVQHDSIVAGDQRTEQCHRLASINSSTSTPTLQGLINAMERRQSYWHGKIPDTGEFTMRMGNIEMQTYMRGMTLEQMKEVEIHENGHLCLQVVQGALAMLQTLDHPPPTF